MAALDELQAYVVERLASHQANGHSWRCHELVRLTLKYWPEYRLNPNRLTPLVRAEVLRKSKAITRARVQETWEAHHGITPLWPHTLAGTVSAIWDVLVELWLTDARHRRVIIAAMAEVAAARPTGPAGPAP